jgi:hypothetical protein
VRAAQIGTFSRATSYTRDVPATIEVDVEARIAEFVDARRPVLAELVRQAVDWELVALVDVEVEQFDDGRRAIAVEDPRLADTTGRRPIVLGQYPVLRVTPRSSPSSACKRLDTGST